jgi:hypothetical protein
VRTTFISLLLVTAVGCTPAQRTATGGAIALGGLGITVVSLASMTRWSCQKQFDGREVCTDDQEPTPPGVAMSGAALGLGVVVLGLALVATADAGGGSPIAAKPDAPELPPAPPTPLEKTDALGMAIARLTLEGVNIFARRAKLLGVDDSQSNLRVDGAHAELSSLRVRTDLDARWRTLRACYEFDREWRVVRFGTTPAACDDAGE